MNNITEMSVFIAEDDVSALEILINYMSSHPRLKLSGIASRGDEALEKLSCNNYDLLLLDLQLPVLSGLEILKKLKNLPHVIFTTNYDQNAAKAFEFNAIDYLLKPFCRERFNQAINKFHAITKNNYLNKKTSKKFCLSFKEKSRHHFVAYEDIFYLSSHSKSTVIHTKEKDYTTMKILKDFEKKLPGEIFLRIHKQYIVNLQQIANMEYYLGGQYIAYLKGDGEENLPVGRAYASRLKERLRV